MTMSTPTPPALPSDAGHVIVGAGAVGCSVAAALAHAGRTDVLVLDAEADIAQGTTSMGAGMFGLVRNDLERVIRDVEGLEMFHDLERDAEVTPAFVQTGSIRVACSAEGEAGLRQLGALARRAGVATELVGPADVQRAWSVVDPSRIRLGLYVEQDGEMRPHRVAGAFASVARRAGVAFATDTTLTGIELGAAGEVTAVRTDRGTVRTPCLIDAAGPSAAAVARMAGLELPIVPVRHSYFVTAPLATITRPLPHLRFTEDGLYARTRDAGVLIGGWERPGAGRSLDPRELPGDRRAPFPELPWSTYEAFAELARDHLPDLDRWPRQSFATGWPTFTADGQHVIGPSSRVPGLVLAAGCNAHGIAGAPAIGVLVAESIAGATTSYLQTLSPDRFAGGLDFGAAIAAARGFSETYNTIAAVAA
jgi:glycine/D-amino acid oxidase-like deaminating enzyme